MTRGNVNIIGAGLCGSLLSIILARRGIKVTLLERQADPRCSEIVSGRSINLVLSARGNRALKYADLFHHIEPLLVPMKGRLIHHHNGSTELQAYGQNENERIYSVSRGALNRLLVETAENDYKVQVRFQHEAVAYYPDEAILRIRNHENSTDYDVTANPVIGADGAGSVIRRAYASESTISASETLLEHSYKELSIPSKPDGGFQLEQEVLHIWPRGGFMLIALPNPGGDFTLTLFLPSDGPNSFAELDNESKVSAFFERHFADVVPLIDNLTANFSANPVGILGTVRCGHWHDRGKVLLIGDAAHAVVPFHGQGMNLAFEDCVILDQVLANPDADWDTIFSVYEDEQIANANAIADMALENYIEMRDTVRDPKFVLRKELSFELERRLPSRFIPRYSMVMFHDEIPYAVAQERGVVQEKLLRELTENAASMAQIDLDAATALVEARLAPLH